jgi:SpoVK/Ycf46/Vps4 family AAA+-type ATPase
MVDHETYHKMDEGATAFTFDKPKFVHSHDTMPVNLSLENQHSQVVFSLLSPTVHGFDLNKKRWIHLRLDSVHSVSWNKKSYDRLVLPDASKDILRTLVLAQQSRRRLNQGIDVAHVDIMEATSHGLTVLLYGGPGTGKTFSTESIAEIAERPLYRINCGDVGMNADAIEKEFAFVLGVGKAWNCVLLLDKAHVFLQRRSTSDSQSDSIISSFLRVLEHYDGIVVLTSSHLDGLDEALVSRIQVVLQCKDLDHSSRKKIWQNFVDKFEEDEGSANFEEIRSHLEDLAEKDLNGHQIRNVFKTAKELATFREERLDWGHLQQALSLSSGSTARRV